MIFSPVSFPVYDSTGANASLSWVLKCVLRSSKLIYIETVNSMYDPNQSADSQSYVPAKIAINAYLRTFPEDLHKACAELVAGSEYDSWFSDVSVENPVTANDNDDDNDNDNGTAQPTVPARYLSTARLALDVSWSRAVMCMSDGIKSYLDAFSEPSFQDGIKYLLQTWDLTSWQTQVIQQFTLDGKSVLGAYVYCKEMYGQLKGHPDAALAIGQAYMLLVFEIGAHVPTARVNGFTDDNLLEWLELIYNAGQARQDYLDLVASRAAKSTSKTNTAATTASKAIAATTKVSKTAKIEQNMTLAEINSKVAAIKKQIADLSAKADRLEKIKNEKLNGKSFHRG
ncbi:hypothetical protein GQ42DRAFT_155962 [Ramicandelaber brevisporus]|nr:hypothetical protein GQ42DRAFT_155962 [Ramicandelaber brevisporus]